MTIPEASAGPLPLAAGTFRIDREGAWHHDDQEVTHPGVLRSLYANLRAEDRTHYLQVGPARIPVVVDDAPFVVTRVEPTCVPEDSQHIIRIHLSDGTAEWLGAEAFWLGPRETPYCRVKSGRFVARLSVAAWLQLARFVEEGAGPGQAVLVLGDRRVPLSRRGGGCGPG